VRGLGYRPVPSGRHEDIWHTHPKAARAGQVSPDRTLEMFAPPVDDQGSVGQCTGQAVTCGDSTSLAAAGVPVSGFLCAQSPYRMARCMERAPFWNGQGDPPALQDNGADPNLVHLALTKYGCSTSDELEGYPGPCPGLTEAYEANVNREPDLAELAEDDAFKLVGQYRVTSTGAQRILDVRAALAAGFAFTLSVYASDDRFQNYVGGVLPPAPDGSPCNHLIAGIGGFTDAASASVFICQNSWSKDWGISGRLWVHEKVILQSDAVHICSVRRV